MLEHVHNDRAPSACPKKSGLEVTKIRNYHLTVTYQRSYTLTPYLKLQLDSLLSEFLPEFRFFQTHKKYSLSSESRTVERLLKKVKNCPLDSRLLTLEFQNVHKISSQSATVKTD